ncbi:unnamed protein product [Lepeophtheirus salmonis]|uniref:(salmon louse) hypothetical protein n=1 Tax=Lepeophtheirus salmonis TaxID=72036 RepID=A0A817FAB9_LEPSM|nr:unnamed protein product [Lepeophtheirus salmonis]CAG9475207.1 unnamed protein product [Lepeophtheirus salmonis]
MEPSTESEKGVNFNPFVCEVGGDFDEEDRKKDRGSRGEIAIERKAMVEGIIKYEDLTSRIYIFDDAEQETKVLIATTLLVYLEVVHYNVAPPLEVQYKNCV